MSNLAKSGVKSLAAATQSALAREREIDEIIARWDNGEKADAAAALREFPHLAASRSAVMILAYEEYCQRKEGGETIVVDQFVANFPEHASAVRRVIRFHQLDPVEPRSPKLLELGKNAGDYRVVDWLGRGAFSHVYLACDLKLANRPVVLKVTSLPGLEPEALATVDSPYVVQVYAATSEKTGPTTIVMPFFGSATFEDLLSRRRQTPNARGELILEVAAAAAELDPRNPQATMPASFARRPFVEGAVWLLRGIAEGLSKAHQSGYLHLDLKPSNILLAAGACPMLADFNLSQRIDEKLKAIGGTVPYMAPEQLRRFCGEKEVEVTAAADVFSLGVIAHELLTGEHPYGPIDPDVEPRKLARQLLEKPPEVRRRPTSARGMNGSLLRLVERCLSTDPKLRPSSEELRSLLTAELKPRARLVRLGLRKPLVTGMVALLVAGAMAGGGVKTYTYLRDYEKNEARKALREKNYTTAMELLAPKAETTTDVEHLSLYALACLQAEKTQDAINMFRRLYGDGKHSPANLNNFARALVFSGKHKEALELLNDPTLDGVRHREILYNRALLAASKAALDRSFIPVDGMNDAINADVESDPRGELSLLIARLKAEVWLRQNPNTKPQDAAVVIYDLRRARENGITQEALLKETIFAPFHEFSEFARLAEIKEIEGRREAAKIMIP
jgi:serine/threonine protein kinase